MIFWSGVEQAPTATAPHTRRVKLYYTDGTGFNYSPDGITYPYWQRFAGHVAFEVDGTVYNYFPDGIAQINDKDYVNNVTNADGKRTSPGQTVYVWDVNATPEETERLKTELMKSPGAYDAWNNIDCAPYSQGAFERTTQNSSQPVKHSKGLYDMNFKHHTPSEVVSNLKTSGRIEQEPIIYWAKDSEKYHAQRFWGVK